MRAIALVEVAGLCLVTLVGFAVLAWLPGGWRARLLPAVPLLGACTLVVSLHLTTIAVGVREGLPVVGAVAVGALLWRSFRRRWRAGLHTWRWLVAALCVGAAFTTLLLLPLRNLGLVHIEPGGSMDGFAYVSNSAWLIDHPATLLPSLAGPPVWSYTHLTLSTGFRQGEELLQASVALLTGHDPRDTWYPVSCLWLALLPGGLIAAASTLGLSRTIGLVAAPLATGASLTLSQVIYSNSAGVLGSAMAPLSLSLIAAYIDGHARGDGEGPPVWLAALVATALASTYTEYVPLVAGGLLAFVVFRRRAEIAAAAAGLARLAGGCAVIGPLAWWRAAQSLRVTTAIQQGQGQSAPFLGVPYRLAASHYAGTLGVLEPTGGEQASYIIMGIIAVGILAAAWLSPARRFFALILGSVGAAVVALSTIHYFPYGQGRAIEITAPLVVLGSVAGYAALTRATRRRWGAYVLVAIASSAGCAVLAINVSTAAGYLSPYPHAYPAARIYRPDAFDGVRRWLTEGSTPRSGSVVVLDTEGFEQLWLQYRLQDLPSVNFPYLVPLFSSGGPPTRFFDGRSRRWAVIEPSLFCDAPPTAVVGGAGDFRFLDLSRGPYVLAAGVTGFSPLLEHSDAHSRTQWMVGSGSVLVLHDAATRSVDLGLRALTAGGHTRLSVRAGGVVLAAVPLSSDPATITVTVPPGTGGLLQLDTAGAGEPIALLSVRAHRP